jgi:predicted amidohydrolase YtcJ
VRGRRFTLIHSYFPIGDSIARARRLGMCVDTQPILYFKDSDAMAEVYGQNWAARFIGLGDWIRSGIPTAINSDHMIGLDPNHSMNSYNPFLAMYIAVSRKNQKGRVYGDEQRISRMAALRAMTSSAAYMDFNEEKIGSLEPGKLADLAVLDRDYLTCPEEEIRAIKVMITMLDGKVVYERL